MRRLFADRLVFAPGVTVILISALFAHLRVTGGWEATMSAYTVELLGIVVALGLLIFLAFRGFTLLLAAPAAAIVAAISSGALAMLPHNGAVVTLLAICGTTRRGSYREIMMVGFVGPLIALTAVIVLGKLFGSF